MSNENEFEVPEGLPEESTEDISPVQKHWQKHRTKYIAGGVIAGTAVVSFVAGKHFQRPIMVNNTVAPNIAPVMENIVNTIVLPAHGDPGDVVQNLRTLETFASKGELARSLGVHRTKITQYFNGQLPDIFGDQFKVIGKGGHPIRIA